MVVELSRHKQHPPTRRTATRPLGNCAYAVRTCSRRSRLQDRDTPTLAEGRLIGRKGARIDLLAARCNARRRDSRCTHRMVAQSPGAGSRRYMGRPFQSNSGTPRRSQHPRRSPPLLCPYSNRRMRREALTSSSRDGCVASSQCPVYRERGSTGHQVEDTHKWGPREMTPALVCCSRIVTKQTGHICIACFPEITSLPSVYRPSLGRCHL